jgi:hypothetical protein
LAIQEVRYDFTEHGEHFRNFFFKILKLVIISKLNCQESNETSVKYFNEIVNGIENCKTHRVKYGKSMIFTKYLQYEFTYQTIKVILNFIDKNLIDIFFESIVEDFVKFFDELSSDTKIIKWNITYIDNNNISENKLMKEEIKNIFYLLESFIESIYYLTTTIPANNNDSLIGKTIEIKDVSVIRKSLNIEILIDDNTIIINLSPKKNNSVSIILDNEENIGKTIKELILQNKKF